MGPEKQSRELPHHHCRPRAFHPLPSQDQSMLTSAGMCMSSTAATGAWAWQ